MLFSVPTGTSLTRVNDGDGARLRSMPVVVVAAGHPDQHPSVRLDLPNDCLAVHVCIDTHQNEERQREDVYKCASFPFQLGSFRLWEVAIMADRTGIEWTDATFNPWIGCTAVSSACDHCYAEAQTKRWGGDFASRRRMSPENSDRDEHSNWGWPLTDIEPLMPYMPASGRQGWWTWDAEQSMRWMTSGTFPSGRCCWTYPACASLPAFPGATSTAQWPPAVFRPPGNSCPACGAGI